MTKSSNGKLQVYKEPARAMKDSRQTQVPPADAHSKQASTSSPHLSQLEHQSKND
jgi:hypothetical protein